MKKHEQIPILIKKGYSNSQIARELKLTLSTVSSYASSFPSYKIRTKLLQNPEFKEYFINIYKNKPISDVVNILSNHIIFSNNIISSQRIYELCKFYDIDLNMPENNYTSEINRIKGYMIRNSKFSAKRRNIDFDLKYTDFELPEYCPLLNIKLTFRTESVANDISHASLDRINNSKGYIKGNVIVISKLANAMKNCANFDQLETFSNNCLKLINHYKNQDALGSITDIFPNISLKN